MRALLLVVASVAVLAAGGAVTWSTVDEGTDRFAGPERALAEDALATSRLATDNPLLSVAVLARRVVSVAPERPGDCADPAFAEEGVYPGHTAEVVGYTLFRAPIVRITVTCGGATYTVD